LESAVWPRTTPPRSEYVAHRLRLIGYFPKDTALPPNWPFSDRVDEICSASGCINRSPQGWLERWLHNSLGFFNTPADACAVLPEHAANFKLYAYRLLRQRFVDGAAEPFAIPEFPVEPLGENFISLGFDAVSRSVDSFFECSPLSCNLMIREVAVNRFCLVDTVAEAVELAESFSRGNQEPGPYHVVQVLRQQRGAAD
jgi:hypothetical protein